MRVSPETIPVSVMSGLKYLLASTIGIPRYLHRRFPLHVHGLTLALGFASAYSIFCNIDRHYVLNSSTIIGALSFILLFLHLRLVDDFEDNLGSSNEGRLVYRVMRNSEVGTISATYIASSIVLFILNHERPTLGTAAAVSASILFVPLVLKRILICAESSTELSTGSAIRDAVLAVFLEGQHFMIILFVYVSWASAADRSLGLLAVLSVTGAFWAAYEFWKYSRYLEKPNWQPYRIPWEGARWILVGLLTVVVACLSVVFVLAEMPKIFAAFVLLLSSLYAAVILKAQPATGIETVQVSARFVGVGYVGLMSMGALVCALFVHATEG